MIAAAGGEDVWWSHRTPESETDSVGILSPDGSLRDVRNPPQPGGHFRAVPGRGHDVVWSQEGAQGVNDGRVGRYSAQGPAGDTSFALPSLTANVPTAADFFSGACTFGVDLYDAPDRAIWATAAAHPDFLNRWAGANDMRSFVPSSMLATPATAVTEGGIWISRNRARARCG